MSGQWDSGVEKPTEGTSCFPRIQRPDSKRERLLRMVIQLLPDEVKIASVYVESLLATRILKEAPTEGWVTTVDGPNWVEKEDRAHMATLELEGDPR